MIYISFHSRSFPWLVSSLIIVLILGLIQMTSKCMPLALFSFLRIQTCIFQYILGILTVCESNSRCPYCLSSWPRLVYLSLDMVISSIFYNHNLLETQFWLCFFSLNTWIMLDHQQDKFQTPLLDLIACYDLTCFSSWMSWLSPHTLQNAAVWKCF